jgi:hypothetical protein
MTEQTAIELVEFELVEAAPGTALLRVAARPAGGIRTDERPTLVVDDGQRVHRLDPLPSPPDPDGLLRVAFSAPASLLGTQTSFSLELSKKAVVQLPAPTRRTPRRGVDSLAARDTETRQRLQELEQRLEASIASSAELRSALETAVEEAARHRTRANELEAERDEARNVAASLAADMDEAETRAEALAEVVRAESGRRETVEQELRDARGELDSLRHATD